MCKIGKRRTFTDILIIVLVTLACFWPSLENDFVDFDDQINFKDNPNYRGLSWTHLKWMFTTFLMGHYIPLTWITLGMDYLLWEMDPFGYHLTNLILHVSNAVLCYFLILALLRISLQPPRENLIRWVSIAGALFFAIHPLRVESVAWITERRDLLSGFFLGLTVLSYLKMARSEKKIRWHLLVFSFFLLSLLSKAWGIVLPIVLLLLDVYPLGRMTSLRFWRCRATWLEKIPYFLAALVFAFLAILAQHSEKATFPFEEHTIANRLQQSCYGLCFYMWKTICPFNLHPYYIIGSQPFGSIKYILCMGIVVGLLISFLFVWKKGYKGVVIGWLSYAVLVSPVLGLAQSGFQLVAERYTYISCVPFAAMFSFFLYLLVNHRPPKIARWKNVIVCFFVLVMMGGLSMLTFSQCKIWKNSVTLWEHTSEKSREISSYFKLLNMYRHEKMEHAAPFVYEKMIHLLEQEKKTSMAPEGHLGIIFAECFIQMGRYKEASLQLDECIQNLREFQTEENKHKMILAHYLYSKIHHFQNNPEKEKESLLALLSLKIDTIVLLAQDGNVEIVVGTDLRERNARRMDGRILHAMALYQIAQSFHKHKHDEQAIHHARRAIDAFPEFIAPYNLLGFIFLNIGATEQAREYFQKAFHLYIADDEFKNYSREGIKQIVECGILAKQESRLVDYLMGKIKSSPLDDRLYFYLGCTYALKKQMGEAIASFERSIELNPKEPSAYLNLVGLYRALGKHAMAQKYEDILIERGRKQRGKND